MTEYLEWKDRGMSKDPSTALTSLALNVAAIILSVLAVVVLIVVWDWRGCALGACLLGISWGVGRLAAIVRDNDGANL